MDTLPERVSPQLLNKALGYGTYGLITYQFLQTIFFAGNLSMKSPFFSYLFPHSVDDEFHNWRSVWSWQYNHPLLNNVLLMALFGLQHSLQARLWFQKGISRNLSAWMERLLYVAGSSIAFSLMMSFWQPMVFPVVWDFTGTALGSALNGLFLAGLTWTLITLWYDASYDLFDFRKSFGEQVAAPGIPDYLPPVYRAIRQPLFMGVLLCYWASPFMTAGHFLFAGLMTLYTMSAVQYQERDKLTRQGAQYAEYQRRVPLYWPSLAALFNESSSITLPSAVEEKFKGAAGDRPPVVSPIDVHRYQHVGTR